MLFTGNSQYDSFCVGFRRYALQKISTEGTKDVAHSQSFRDATEKKEGGSLAPGFRVRMSHTPVILCLSKEDVGTKAFVKERGEQLFLSLNVFAERCVFWKRGRCDGDAGEAFSFS